MELGVAGIRSSLQKLQNLASFIIIKGSLQYGHIKSVILTGGKSLKSLLWTWQNCDPSIA